MSKAIPSINNNIKGAVKFYDGSFNDSKLNISIIQTAQNYGCEVRNYHQLDAFIYKNEKIAGLRVFDKKNEKEYFVKSNCIVNATGHYTDSIRKLDNDKAKEITSFSKGSHIVISQEKLQIKEEGIIIPNTKDGRVLFVLPWLNHTLIGTTDINCKFSNKQKASKEEKEYLLKHLNKYFNTNIKLEDILSSWCGIRTLLKIDESKSKDIVREHIIEKSNTNLISIAGGKWTTSRKIAFECLELIFKEELLENQSNFSFKEDIQLYGHYENKEELLNKLKAYGINDKTKNELINNYGKNSLKICEIALEEKAFNKIHEQLPYIKAEILYCIKYEYIQKPLDFLARRLRLAFLDKKLCNECLEYVTIIICEHFNYDETKYNDLYNEAKRELDEFF